MTPRALKACGLLALLLDAPEFTRARVALQDLLWSDRGQAQGAASLRQTLSEVRNAFGPARDVLKSDRRTVSLAIDRVASDLTDPAERAVAVAEGRIFLEDLDIRDPEFENWLRDRRQFAETPPRAPRVDHRTGSKPDAVPQLVLASPPELDDAGLGKYVLQGIARGVVDRGSVAVNWTGDNSMSTGDGAGLKLEVDALEFGSSKILRIQMVDPQSGRVGWQLTESLDAGEAPELPRLISEAVDRTVETLAGIGLRGPAAASGEPFFLAIQEMFQTRGLDFEALKNRFHRSYERDPRGIYLACEAFLTCYIIGERRVVNLEAFKDEARDLVRRAVEAEPHNAMVAALCSHVYSFALGEFAVAHELAERSVRLDRNNVLAWTFLGSAKIFCDDVANGYKCILTARQISGEGPYRHMVDFFASMAAMLSGDFVRGIALSETVNALAPDFAPALRYLLAGYILERDFDRAEDALNRLCHLEPDFELRLFAEPEYPVPALRRTGLLDISRLPALAPRTSARPIDP